MGSSPFRINTTDLIKVLRHAAVVIAGYVAVVVLQSFSSDVSTGAINLGQFSLYQGLIITVTTSAIELVRRWVADNR